MNTQFFHLMFQKHSAIMLLIDPNNGQIVDSNEAASRFYGYSVAELNTINMQQEINLLPLAEITQLRQAVMQGKIDSFIAPHRLASGEIRTVEIQAAPIMWDDGQVLFYIIHDITERVRVAEALRKSETKHLLHELFKAIPVAIFYKDLQGRYIACNQAAATLMGRPMAEIIGRTMFDIAPQEEYAQQQFDFDLALLAQPHQHQVYEHTAYYPALQAERTFLFTKSVIKDVHDQPTGIMKVMTDITERKQLEEKMHVAQLQMVELATHDFLTGLHNRVLLTEKLTHALNQRQANQLVAVMTLDMDDFKKINDNYGHHEGDRLLIEIATRLKELLGETDTVIRMGSDEFLLIIPDLESQVQVEALAKRILKSGRRQFQLGHVAVSPSFSLGIALCPIDDTTPESLLVNSDRALYHAKSMGRNCHAFAHNMSEQIRLGRTKRRLGTI